MTMRTTASPRLIGYAAIGAIFVLGGILLGRPEPAVIGVGFMAVLAFAVAGARSPILSLDARLDRQEVIEGDHVSLDLRLNAATPVPWLQLLIGLPRGVEARTGLDVETFDLSTGADRSVSIPLTARRWGVFRIGNVVVSARDALGFFAYESELRSNLLLRVYPTEERLRQAVRPLETQVYSGDEVARKKGDGSEFAGVRPFEPGDRVRHVNWAVSTRLGKLHVNELHPERNADVVIFLDAFTEVQSSSNSTLIAAVRATASVARHYLARRDRVALVSFGGTLRWQLPAMGTLQGYRILEALLSTDSSLSYAWKEIDVIPPRTLPPRALVVAITPLLDERSVRALFDLRGRGFDLVIVEVSPAAFVGPPQDEADELARRLWLMRRESLRHDYWRAGVPVTTWDAHEVLAPRLQEIARFRQFAQTSRVS